MIWIYWRIVTKIILFCKDIFKIFFFLKSSYFEIIENFLKNIEGRERIVRVFRLYFLFIILGFFFVLCCISVKYTVVIEEYFIIEEYFKFVRDFFVVLLFFIGLW